jgi:hypothetical protein
VRHNITIHWRITNRSKNNRTVLPYANEQAVNMKKAKQQFYATGLHNVFLTNIFSHQMSVIRLQENMDKDPTSKTNKEL